MCSNTTRSVSTRQAICVQCGNHFKPKRGNAGKFCSRQCNGKWQGDQKRPVTKEWLIQKYVVERIDCTAIALIVGRDSKSVWSWLKYFGIETRKRGFASESTWRKKGEPSAFKGKRHSESTKQKIREIAIAQGRVPYDPKIGSYMKGRRGALTTNWKGGVTPERQAFYSSPEWKSAVKSVWKRDLATCQRCLKKNSGKQRYAFDIHHIVSFSARELRAELSNLVLLCERCHYWVHSSENINREFIGDFHVSS